MNKILKYIIDENEIPIFFSCEKLHSDVLRENALSAGFLSVRFDNNLGKFIIKCFGESSSLKLKADIKKDEQIINFFFNS